MTAKRVGLIGPALVVLLAVIGWPLGRAVYTSLFNYPYTNPADREFVGLDNYLDVMTNPGWWQAVGALFAVVAVVVSAQILLGFVFANVLHQLIRTAPIARILVLLPFAAMSVLSALSWRQAVDGGYLGNWFGVDSLGDRAGLVALCLSEVWRGTGIVAVILLAGLMRIKPGLVQAAVADGATARQRLTRIVLPALSPAAAVAIVYRSIDSLRMFDGPHAVMADSGRLRLPQLELFDTTLNQFELGLGATMSVVFVLLVAVAGIIAAQALRVRRAW